MGDYDAILHHYVTNRHLFCTTAGAMHARAPVFHMSMYNVQFSQLLHTSLVFLSECNTQSHTAV